MKTSIPSDQIKKFIVKRFGSVTDFYQLTEGLSSQAFGFNMEGESYVIRVNPSIDSFKKDAYASHAFGSSNLPIPEVLDVGNIGEGNAFCISRKAKGTRIHDLNNRELGQIAAPAYRVIHSIAHVELTGTAGFGRFNAEGEAPFSSWKDFLTSIWDSSYYNWQLADKKIDMRIIEKMFDLIQRLSKDCPEKRSLIHGDFGSYNVLAHENRITQLLTGT